MVVLGVLEREGERERKRGGGGGGKKRSFGVFLIQSGRVCHNISGEEGHYK